MCSYVQANPTVTIISSPELKSCFSGCFKFLRLQRNPLGSPYSTPMQKPITTAARYPVTYPRLLLHQAAGLETQ